jgi:hypothetical protein
MNKFKLVLDTQRRNLRLAQYDQDTVMVPFDHLDAIVEAFHQQKATISSDRNLTNEGKAAALDKARITTREAISAWHEARLKGIDADLLEQRAALMASATVPDPKRIEIMSSALLKFTPHERAVFYNAATDDERRVMEGASAATGRLPSKTDQGLELKPLLDPEMVSEAILARAESTNPVAAQKVRELAEVKAMQVTITGVALSEIGHQLYASEPSVYISDNG